MILDRFTGDLAGARSKTEAAAREITARDLEELLAAAPRDEKSHKVLENVDFKGATFLDPVDFTDVVFAGDATFEGAVFKRSARFVWIEVRQCNFNKAVFEGELYVDSWNAEQLKFEGCTFAQLARFYRIFTRFLSFSGSRFLSKTGFGDNRVDGIFAMAHVLFTERVGEFVAGCRVLSLKGSRLERGGVLHLHGGQIDASGFELGASVLIAGSRRSGQFLNQDASLVVDGVGWRPRLVSLQEADVERLVLQDVDLAQCRLTRCINLDSLRLEGLCRFDAAPEGLFAGRAFPFVWGWTPRQCLHEERIWRTCTPKAKAWLPHGKEPPSADGSIGAPQGRPSRSVHIRAGTEMKADAERLAKTYRALRKGREQAKNEPGAADFYYGEMEMRRAGTGTAGEKAMIWLYWLVSGYGLRPVRTLLALLVVLAASSQALAHYGFANPASYDEAFLAALAAAVNLEYLKPETFSLAGQWVRIGLKVLCPTLFGVMLLALWARIKR